MKVTELENKLGHHTNNEVNIIETLETIIDNKFEEVEKRLKQTLVDEVQSNTKKVENKLDEVRNNEKTYATMVKNDDNDWGITEESWETVQSKKNTDFKRMLREVKNDELAEERDQKRRACNFIIHGVAETDDSSTKENDENLVKELIKTIDSGTPLKCQVRLGEKTLEKKRPIKVTLNSVKA